MRAPAYQRADAYFGPVGPSWLHRWAIGEQRPPGFFAGARAVDLVATEDFILFVYKLCAIAEAEAYDSRAAVWRDVKKAHVECAPRAMYGKSLT